MSFRSLCASLAVMAALSCGEATAAVHVRTTAQFNAAVQSIGNRTGTIVLQRGRYSKLRIVGREGRWLTIKAQQGALTKHVVVRGSSRVRLINLRVTNYWGGDALVHVLRSSRVWIEGATVVGKPGRHARIRAQWSRYVTVRGSDLSLCGEKSVCVGTPGSSLVIIAGNTFHDCFGCDFVHVSRVNGLVLRGNTFDRAVPSGCTSVCNHQDLVQVVGGYNLLIERNRFGLYSMGAAQLYVSGQYGADNIIIRDNEFLLADPTVPDVVAVNGIILGNPTGYRGVPTRVVVSNNVVLSGAPRSSGSAHWPGVANSLLISEVYQTLPEQLRPLVIDNVLAVTSHPGLCDANAQGGVCGRRA